jgi:hypothetical protein
VIRHDSVVTLAVGERHRGVEREEMILVWADANFIVPKNKKIL